MVPTNVSTAVTALNAFITAYNVEDFDENQSAGIDEHVKFDALVDAVRFLVRALSDATHPNDLGSVSLLTPRSELFGSAVGRLAGEMRRKGIYVA